MEEATLHKFVKAFCYDAIHMSTNESDCVEKWTQRVTEFIHDFAKAHAAKVFHEAVRTRTFAECHEKVVAP